MIRIALLSSELTTKESCSKPLLRMGSLFTATKTPQNSGNYCVDCSKNVRRRLERRLVELCFLGGVVGNALRKSITLAADLLAYVRAAESGLSPRLL